MRGLLLAILVALSSIAGCLRPDGSTGAPLVLLVSLDGFRWDYLHHLDVPFLRALAARGVRAEGLVPVFPALTFPNHYTVVTGLRPARHGIVSNTMVDPAIPGRFTLSERTVMADARWWGGEPIWLTGARHGRRSATMFWPGSDVAIHGQFPTYWRPFDDDLPAGARVDQALAWLRLPESERPSFLTLYLSDVDSAGHDFGPDSAEVSDAAARLDRELARLAQGIEAAGLAGRLHWVVVSDHGMAALDASRVIVLDDYLDPAAIDVLEWGSLLTFSPRAGSVHAAYSPLAGRHPAMRVYLRDAMPEHFGLRHHPRVPPIVAVADEGWTITSRARLARRDPARPWGGAHGFDPSAKTMQGLFVAAGPAINAELIVPPFEAVHIYELMCRILGWSPAPNDGDPAVTAGMLRDGR